MLLRTSSELAILVAATVVSLKKLNLEFIQNQTPRLVEFEINTPSYFRLVLEERTDPIVRNNIILPSISKAKGSTIDIRFGLDSSEVEKNNSIVMAKKLLKTVVSTLGAEPWKGLGFRELRKERKKWNEFLNSSSAS